MYSKVIGVIGAGVMGVGVASSIAQKKYKVILVDLSEQILDIARQNIYDTVRFQNLFSKGETVEEPEMAISRIEFTTDYNRVNDVDFVIENVTENYNTKEGVYKNIDLICPERTTFLVNTSCISITKIASLTKRPDRVIGVHFMNPVAMKPVVECIRGLHTSDQTIAATENFLASLGKECIIVNDYPGFVSNRLSHLLMNEAAFVVQDQVASPMQVDEIFKKCFGHKMGPLETADLIGLDTVVDSLAILYQSYQDTKFRCCPLLKKMVDAGFLGKKSGQGFYSYT